MSGISLEKFKSVNSCLKSILKNLSLICALEVITDVEWRCGVLCEGTFETVSPMRIMIDKLTNMNIDVPKHHTSCQLAAMLIWLLCGGRNDIILKKQNFSHLVYCVQNFQRHLKGDIYSTSTSNCVVLMIRIQDKNSRYFYLQQKEKNECFSHNLVICACPSADRSAKERKHEYQIYSAYSDMYTLPEYLWNGRDASKEEDCPPNHPYFLNVFSCASKDRKKNSSLSKCAYRNIMTEAQFECFLADLNQFLESCVWDEQTISSYLRFTGVDFSHLQGQFLASELQFEIKMYILMLPKQFQLDAQSQNKLQTIKILSTQEQSILTCSALKIVKQCFKK